MSGDIELALNWDSRPLYFVCLKLIFTDFNIHLFYHHPLVPIKITSTAAYVAVAATVSVLFARWIRLVMPANDTTATLVVTRLFVKVSPVLMITIGTTRLSTPGIAIMNRASLSTKGETCSGGSPLRYSSVRRSCSCFVYANWDGRRALSHLRKGSTGIRDWSGIRR